MLRPVLILIKIKIKRPLALRNLLRKPPKSPLHSNPKTRPKANKLKLSITSRNLIILHLLGPLNEPILRPIPNIRDPSRIAIDIERQDIVIIFLEDDRAFRGR